MHTAESLPAYHIRPSRGWLNDPNGITRYNGRWHVFFQHNPSSARHATIHWGHVSSADLVSWQEHPIAFGPEPGQPDAAGCWSGAFLPGLDRPAVAYTGLLERAEQTTVCVRFAQDEDLVAWSVPSVVADQPEGIGLAVMRDPYPFEWGGRRFAVVGAGMTDGTPSLLLFGCDDPAAWTFEGVWLDGRDAVAAGTAPAEVWECPQLVRLGDSWLLGLSLWSGGQLGDVVYLVGDLHGEPGGVPGFTARGGGLLDHGPDFYAPQIVPDGEALPLMFGWIRQEDAPDEAPEDAVAGCLTLPRRLSLQGTRVEVSAEPALSALGSRPVTLAEDSGAYALPRRARLTVAGTQHVTLVARTLGSTSRVPLAFGDGGGEIWLDGEVVEAFPAGEIASTIRLPGCADWALAGPIDPAAITVQEVMP